QAPPTSQTVSVGQDVRFGVAASGVPTPTYQWLKDGVAIPGATEATLQLPAVQADAAGAYSVVVTNALGTVTSAPATLTVVGSGAPSLVTSPSAQTVAIAETATFSASATGTPVLAYQWLKDG